MKNLKDAMMLAKEWARQVNAIEGVPQHIIAEEFAWGFNQVELGRHPTIVLKDVVERIEARRICVDITVGKKNGGEQ